MSQNHPMMPQKRPKIRTPQHRGCGVLLRRPHTPFAEVSCPVCAPCSPCWWLRSLSPPSPVPTPPARVTAAATSTTATPAAKALSHRAARGTQKPRVARRFRSEEHTSELQSLRHLVCRLLLEKKKAEEATATATPTP